MITSSYQLSGLFCLPIMSPVRCPQPRIPRHVGGEDRGQPAFDAGLPYGLHGASSWRLMVHEPLLGAH